MVVLSQKGKRRLTRAKGGKSGGAQKRVNIALSQYTASVAKKAPGGASPSKEWGGTPARIKKGNLFPEK